MKKCNIYENKVLTQHFDEKVDIVKTEQAVLANCLFSLFLLLLLKVINFIRFKLIGTFAKVRMGYWFEA